MATSTHSMSMASCSPSSPIAPPASPFRVGRGAADLPFRRSTTTCGTLRVGATATPDTGSTPRPTACARRRVQGGSELLLWVGTQCRTARAPNYDSNAAAFWDLRSARRAHGSLTTNTFSLEGYSFGDSPTLYFNYLVNHDTIVDSFRVFISNDGASMGRSWHRLLCLLRRRSPSMTTGSRGYVECRRLASGEGRPQPVLWPGQSAAAFEFSTEGGRRQGDPDVGNRWAPLPGGELQDGDSSFIDNSRSSSSTWDSALSFPTAR